MPPGPPTPRSDATLRVLVDARAVPHTAAWSLVWARQLLRGAVEAAHGLELLLWVRPRARALFEPLLTHPRVREVAGSTGWLARWQDLRRARALRPYLVHVLGVPPVGARTGLPEVVTVLGDEVRWATARAKLRWVARPPWLAAIRGYRLMGRARRVVATSSAAREALARGLGLAVDTVPVILGGADHVPLGTPSTPGDAPAFVACIGEGPPRALATVLAAFARAGAAIRNARLDLVTPAKAPAEVAKTLARFPLRHRVFVFENASVAQRVTILRRAAGLVVPAAIGSRFLPIAEAMRAGCPVIAPEESEAQEVAARAAIYVEPGDEEALATAMLDLVRNPPLQQALRDAGRARSGLFTWAHAGAQLFGVYRGCLDASARGPQPGGVPPYRRAGIYAPSPSPRSASTSH